MDKVRIGIIGIGNMGSGHSLYLLPGEVSNAELTAICDIDPDRIKWARENLGENIRTFDSADDMMASGTVDAVIVATPHYLHPPLAIQAMNSGVACAYRKARRRLYQTGQRNERRGRKKRPRLRPHVQPAHHWAHQKLKDLVTSGDLGEIQRHELHNHHLVPLAKLLRFRRLARDMGRRRRRRLNEPVSAQPRPLAMDLRYAYPMQGICRIWQIPRYRSR